MTTLNINVCVFKDKEQREQFYTAENHFGVSMLDKFLISNVVEKTINVGRLWEYCYSLSKNYIIEKLELELKTYKEQYKEIIVLEDV